MSYFFPLTPAKAGAYLPKDRTRGAGKRWVPAFAGMIGVLLAGCTEVSNPKLWIEVPGEVITEFSNETIGVETGMTKNQITQLVEKHGYVKEPEVISITSAESAAKDCDADKPAGIYTFKKVGKHDEQEVEYWLSASLADIIDDGVCEFVVLGVGPFQIRKPSYMKEINAKNQ